MKRVVSVSLGSSRRDGKVTQQICGQAFSIERIGTDGDKEKAIQIIRDLDGKVDAFGLGGTDLYIYAGKKRYTFKESAKIAAAARITPIVDGSGIKNTLERQVINNLAPKYGIDIKHKKVLLVCAVDRFGMAEALAENGCKVVFGDLLFGLGLPIPIRDIHTLGYLASLVVPIITKLPIRLFYPTGDKQKECVPRFGRFFEEADIIAGDFHFIRRYMPERLDGKTIITNTVTQEDEQLLGTRGVSLLLTTTPEMGGRSFGTNVLESILVAISGRRPEQLTVYDYELLLHDIGVESRYKKLG